MPCGLEKSGFILLKPFRYLFCAGRVVMPLVFSFLAVFILFAMSASVNSFMRYLPTGFFLIAAVFSLIITYKKKQVVKAKFCYNGKSITNYSKRRFITVDLQQPFFLTRASLNFYVGKTKFPVEYCILSNQPLVTLDCVLEGGLASFQYLWCNNTVLVPFQSGIGESVCYCFGVDHILTYPQVYHFP